MAGIEFSCDACGLCCEHVVDHPDIVHVDGCCVLYDRETRRCSDYANRPLVCNVSASYQNYRHLSPQEYLDANYSACAYLKETYRQLTPAQTPAHQEPSNESFAA